MTVGKCLVACAFIILLVVIEGLVLTITTKSAKASYGNSLDCSGGYTELSPGRGSIQFSCNSD